MTFLKVLTLSLLSLSLLLIFPSYTQAQTESPDRTTPLRLNLTPKPSSTRPPVEVDRQARDTVRVQSCEQVTARVNNRIHRYQDSSDRWHLRYQGIQDRLDRIITSLEENECDASVLVEDSATLAAYLDEFSAAFRLFITSFQGSRASICDEAGSFATSLTQSRTQLADVKAKAQKLSSFVSTTLKPHVNSAVATCQLDKGANRGQ